MALGQKTGGRTIGTPNKTTVEIRQSLQILLETNLPNLQSWLNQTAENNPTKAIELVLKMAEFVIPKNPVEVNDESEKKRNNIRELFAEIEDQIKNE